MTNALRAFSILGFGAALVGGIAWTSGELQRFGFASPLEQSASLVDAAPALAKAELSNLTKAADAPANPVVDQAVLAPTSIPAFDIVRVQPDGSMVIAGRATPGAAIDIVAGDRVIGQTSTDESGSFAFILDQPLPPGDYNIGLVARVNGATVASEEKALVQIPNQPGGDVLAIVTAPNAAPEVLAAGAVNPPVDQAATIVAPAPELPAGTTVQNPDTTVAANTVASAAASPDLSTAETASATSVAPQSAASADSAAPLIVAQEPLRIEAVEIDGAKTFIAGTAPAGSSIRLYLGDQLLGDAKTNAEGRFLVETEQPVALGTQVLRADSVDANGDVTARASVPFERVDSNKLALVATPAAQTNITIPASDLVLNQAPPQLTQVDTSVIIRKGDTLWQIARRVYGKGVTFSTIYNANVTQISDPNRIFPGQIFAVPRNSSEGDAANFEGIIGQKKEDVIVR